MNRIERVVVDENVGPESPLVEQLLRRLGQHSVQFVFLATERPGIPDIERSSISYWMHVPRC